MKNYSKNLIKQFSKNGWLIVNGRAKHGIVMEKDGMRIEIPRRIKTHKISSNQIRRAGL